MDFTQCESVRPLNLAENRFLELLITEFTLQRTKVGAELVVSFDENTPCIWMNRGKSEVLDRMPDYAAKVKRYQSELDDFLIKGKGDRYDFNDPDFPFRYASGGALPILHMGGKDYYCLFYREVDPIGWNIANGGCDSRVELLSPLDTVERELREELVVFDPVVKKKRYVHEADVGKSLDRPEFAFARRFLQKLHPEWEALEKLEEVELPTKWLRGTDSVKVVLPHLDSEFTTTDCFLNINAKDFGIEIDRVIKLTVDQDARLVDGEILTGWVRDGKPLPTKLVNAPIGLFEIDRMDPDSTDIRPQRLFYSAQERDADKLDDVVNEFMQEIEPWLTPKAVEEFYQCEEKYALCPATASIVKRYQSLLPPAEMKPAVPARPEPLKPRGEGCDVFICSAGEDFDLAEVIERFLLEKAAEREDGKGAPFFSEHGLQHADFGPEIEKALDSANCLIVVASDPIHVEKPYPKFEWHSFHVTMLNGRKRDNAELLSYVTGFDPARQLPYTLSARQAVIHDIIDPRRSFEKLYRFVEQSFG